MNARTSLLSLLDYAATRGEEFAFVQRRGLRAERWTYAQLAATAFQFARELEARGIGKGDRVLLWGTNGGAWVVAWFGCLARGAVVVPLDITSAADFIERIQQQVNAKLIVCDEPINSIITSGAQIFSLKELRETVSCHSAESFTDESLQPDDLAEIIFTSGTTAEPKGVCLSHRNLLANLAPLEQGMDEYRKWERPFHPIRFLCLLPLSHVFGQFMGIFVPQLLGGEVHFSDSLNPADIIAAVKRERISVIAAVPRQLETLRDKLERDYAAAGKLESFRQRFAAAEGKHPLMRWWMRWWRFRDIHKRLGWKCWAFVAGGATLPVETEQFWMRLGFPVVQGYGMTETASLVSVNHPFKLSKGSIGKALPGQELKLDTDGTILVRGANVATGYWQAGQAHSLTTEGGWLRTGDIGALDAQGNLFFKGRAKDVIVTASGLNIFPADLEAALNQQSAIKESCVVGIETSNGPEAIAMLIARGSTEIADAVQSANATLNEAQQLRRWMLWPEADFPRTATQKVRKPLVRHWAEQQLNGQASDGAAERASPLIQLLAQVSGRSESEVQALSLESELSSGLGLDSLGRVSLISALEDRFQLELDEAAIMQQTTLRELERLVAFSVTPAHEQAGTAPALPKRVYPYPTWAMNRLTWLVRMFWYYALILPETRLLCWTRTRGTEKLRDLREPALFICNHISMIDHGLILAALPWRFRHRMAIAMDGERLRGFRYPDVALPWWHRTWLRMQYILVVTCFNVFPLPHQSGFRRSFEYAGAAVERGYSVLVFPEGRVTTDGTVRPFMSGIGLLAKELSVPVVPIRIDGLYELKIRQRRWAAPGSVTITFSHPLSVEEQQSADTLPRQLHEIVASS